MLPLALTKAAISSSRSPSEPSTYLAVTTIPHTDISRHWAGLSVLDRLCESSEPLPSQDVARILGARSTKGVGSVLRPTRDTLARAGMRFDEAVSRRSLRRRTVWTAGKRILQARHVLEIERRRWLAPMPGELGVLTDEPARSYRGPVLVLRALKLSGGMFRVDGGMAELDWLLDEETLDPVAEATYWRVGELFVDRIEPAETTTDISVPTGYEENGIWVRGDYDYAHPRVAGAIGTGRSPTIFTHIGEATWLERRMPLVNAKQQVDAVRTEGGHLSGGRKTSWRVVEQDRRFRYVNWISAGPDLRAHTSAPPLRMRLRCWYDVVLELPRGKRVVLHEEGLRGDEGRTASRAIARWRKIREESASRLVSVRDIRISRKQPRPMLPEGLNC